jgi:hypothetical protein
MSALTVHLEDSLLAVIMNLASKQGTTADAYVASTLARTVSAQQGLEDMRREAAMASREEFEFALNEVRALNAPPAPGDEMPVLP